MTLTREGDKGKIQTLSFEDKVEKIKSGESFRKIAGESKKAQSNHWGKRG